MGAKEMADRYIQRDGSPLPDLPTAEIAPTPHVSAGAITISIADYKRLLLAAELDDMIVFCETCGAWIDKDEDAFFTGCDFNGCWKTATGKGPCKSHRAILDDN